jgi:hypothetical protein
VAAISAHDFNQNHAILRSRAIGASVDYAPAIKRKGPMERWYSIREERRDALRVVAQALVIHADYSYDSEYLFEVKPRLSEAIEKQGQAAKPWLSVVITKLGAAAKQRLSVVITKLGAITNL